MAGVLAGHWLTYMAVAPIAGSRATILHDTGHAYLGMANDLALVVALFAIATMFIGQLTSPGATCVQGITARVVRFQVSAFILLEGLERLTSGSPLSELIHTRILPVGIVAQVGIGFIVARAIRWLLRAADRVAAALARGAVPARRTLARTLRPRPVFIRAGRQLSAVGVRGPPSAV